MRSSRYIQIISDKSLNNKWISLEKNNKDEWLNFYFKNEVDVINIIKEDERIKNIITVQAIYYLNIFKK